MPGSRRNSNCSDDRAGGKGAAVGEFSCWEGRFRVKCCSANEAALSESGKRGIRMPEVMKDVVLNPRATKVLTGAGARYQAGVRSSHFGIRLAGAAAAMVPAASLSMLPRCLTVEQVAPLAKDYELRCCTEHPSFTNDAKFAAHLKEVKSQDPCWHGRRARGVLPMHIDEARPAVDWVAVGEFDYIARRCVAQAAERYCGLAYRDNGRSPSPAPAHD